MKVPQPKLFEFTWWVAEDGYQWEQGPRGRLLAPRDPAGFRTRAYSPLQKHTGLFREFAQTPRTPDGVLAFANRFGPLTIGQFGRHEEFETLWVRHLLTMSRSVALWDLVQRRDQAQLAEHIFWTSNPLEDVVVAYDP